MIKNLQHLYTIDKNTDSVSVAKNVFTSIFTQVCIKAHADAKLEIDGSGNYMIRKEPTVNDCFNAFRELDDDVIRNTIAGFLSEFEPTINTLKEIHINNSTRVDEQRKKTYLASYTHRYIDLQKKAKQIKIEKDQRRTRIMNKRMHRLINRATIAFDDKDIIQNAAKEIGLYIDLVDSLVDSEYNMGNYGYQGEIEFDLNDFTNDYDQFYALMKQFPKNIRIDGHFVVYMDLDF